MMEILLATLVVVNQILDAGNSITAFALLLYALTFNLRERVARTFALVLACLTVVYFGDVLASLSPRHCGATTICNAPRVSGVTLA